MFRFACEKSWQHRWGAIHQQVQNIEQYVQDFQKFMDNPDENSMLFAYKRSVDVSGLECNEDAWSKQLVGGLNKLLPFYCVQHDADVRFTFRLLSIFIKIFWLGFELPILGLVSAPI